MGYTYRNNGQITDFWPDDTAEEFYISCDSSIPFTEVQQEIDRRWPGIGFEQIEISSESIHTSCLTYDQYDSSDYTQFLVIRRIK